MSRRPWGYRDWRPTLLERRWALGCLLACAVAGAVALVVIAWLLGGT